MDFLLVGNGHTAATPDIADIFATVNDGYLQTLCATGPHSMYWCTFTIFRCASGSAIAKMESGSAALGR